MFSTSCKILIDPTDFEPLLLMVTTHRRSLRRSLRWYVGVKFTVRRVRRQNWYGIPMWHMDFHFPNGITDMNKVIKTFPSMKPMVDHNWGYKVPQPE